MKIKCNHCGKTLEGDAPDGVAFKCPACGNYLFTGGQSAPSPWRDNLLVPFVTVLFVIPAVLVAMYAGESEAVIAAVLAGAFFAIWGISLLRACAYRLMHIEELLSRR